MHGVTSVLVEDLSAIRKVADMKSRRYFTSQVEDEDVDSKNRVISKGKESYTDDDSSGQE